MAECAIRCDARALTIVESVYHFSLFVIVRSSSAKSNSLLPSSSRKPVIASSFFACAASARFCSSVFSGAGLCIQCGSLTRSTLSTICSVSRAWIRRPDASTLSGSSSHTFVNTAALSFHFFVFISAQPKRYRPLGQSGLSCTASAVSCSAN